MKQDVIEVVKAVENATTELRAALFRARRIWNRGNLTPEERRAMNLARAKLEQAVSE